MLTSETSLIEKHCSGVPSSLYNAINKIDTFYTNSFVNLIFTFLISSPPDTLSYSYYRPRMGIITNYN